MKHPFEETRQYFPILKDKIQLSSCSQSALHVDVKKSFETYVHSWESKGMDWGGWMEACENARLEFARMINADVNEVAIVSSVSHAVSSIATSLAKQERNKVYITDFDFPTMGHVWLSHQDQYDVRFLEDFEGDFIEATDYEQQIDSDALMVNTSHVSFYDGYKQDLKEVAKVVHDKGASLLVDAYQSLGQAEIDVKDMDIDILTSGLQKYALGTPGIAFLYIKKEFAEAMVPKITGWFGQSDPFLFDIKNVDYGEGAKRFDTGTFPMINGFAAEAALKVLNQYKMSDIESYLENLSAFALETVKKYGLTTKSPLDVTKKGSNTAIYAPNASELETQLSQNGIMVSARNDVVRIAPHFYNTKEDIETAIKELKKLMG